METDPGPAAPRPDVTGRLRAAGCVWAEDEAALLTEAAGSAAELDALVARRVAGEPLEQVIGWAWFHGLRIRVDAGVFAPRRRSEFLVDVALQLARERGAAGPPVIADLCCGTGALGLAVAAGLAAPAAAGAALAGGKPASGESAGGESAGGESAGAGPAGGESAGGGHSSQEPGAGECSGGEPAGGGMASGRFAAQLYAADLDPAAVACARRNVEPAGGRVYAGDLFAALPAALRGRLGVLICNAPYVPTDEIAFLPAEAREYEARTAFDGGADGLAVLRRAVAGAPDWLAPGGSLLTETSERQAGSLAAAMTAAGLTPRVHEDEESGATVVTGTSADDGG